MIRLLQKSSTGAQKEWSIWIEADRETVTVRWGLVGMKLQVSSDTVGSKGKEGTKSYKSPEQVAQEKYDRLIKKKREEGYREAGEQADVQDWLTELDKSFVPAKPINDLDLETLAERDARGELLVQRKRDGQRHLALITRTGEVKLYSRRLENMTGNFPLLCQAIKALGLPKGTILDGEIIVDRNGVDDFRAVATMTKAKPEKSALREQALGDQVRYMVFDVLYFATQCVWEKPYEYRYQEVLLNYIGISRDKQIFVPVELPGTLRYLYDLATKEKWEGLVCWFANEPTLLRNGGKPKRIGCAKLKPIIDKDVIAVGYELGSGDQSNVVGALLLQEIDPNTGEYRDAGKCGTGFDMATRKEALTWQYPVVIKIEADKQEPTGKFRFPVFKALHEDKTPDECIGVDLSELE